MNPQNRNKIIILVVLGLVAAFFALKPLFTQSDFDRKYQENLTKNGSATPSGDTGDAAASSAADKSTSVKSQFQKASVDIDQLIASVKEVGFDYDTDRTRTDPMTPLVGPSAHKAIAASGEEGGTPGAMSSAAGDAQMVLRTFRVTGIMWDKRDPMAVLVYPVKGELTSEVVTRGYAFPDSNVRVLDIDQDHVILDANGTQVSLQLEER